MATIFFAILCVISSVIIETNGYLYCLDDCHFSQSLYSPFIILDKCNKTKGDSLCEVIFGSRIPDDRKRSTNEKNDKYDYVTETTTISNTQIITKLFYSCTLEDQCEEKFLLEIQPKLIKKDYTNLQKKLMDILTTSDTSSLTCNQWLKNEPVKCNGTCFGARKQLIDLKTHQPMKTYDSPTCEFSKVSPNVKIHVAKVPMSNGMFLTRNIYYYCSTIDCNRQEITERVEKVINENYKAFYEE